jgi:murein DD-endopeptidase MepM/ murein hydrolase activator NlpD
MPHHVEPFRARAATRFAIAAMISAGLGGCGTDMNRFNDNPFSTGSLGRPSANQEVAAVAAPTSRIESQPLPQTHAAALPAPPAHYRSGTGAVPASPPPVQVAKAAPQPASGVHVVAPGESLLGISRKYGKKGAEVARANGITPTTNVRIGQRLVIPGVAQQKIQTTAVAEKPKAPAARALALPPKLQAAAPQAAPAQVAAKPVPAQTAAKPAPKGVQTASLAPVALPVAKPAEQPKERAHVASAPTDAAADAKENQPSAMGGPSFRWPVRGRVIAGFGPKPNGQQNDGINLAVPEGTSVKAAEDGVVAYAGNELKGYGNLVLVRHSNGYVTAYAHASELKVKRGDPIKRGQIIALAGQTGTVSSPQLHFEIRKGSTPVDPNQYLNGN